MTNITLRNTLYIACPRLLRPYWDRVEASDTGSRLARGAFWSLSGAVISRGLMLAAFILVARILGRETYGEFGIIRSTMNMFVVLAGFGFGLTATKYVAEFRATDPDRAGRIMALSGLFAMGTGALMALGLLVLAPWLAGHTINAPHLTTELRIGAIILFINVLNGAQTGALAGLEAFKSIARINLLVGFFSFPLMIASAYVGGLTGAVWALVGNVFINWLLNHLALRKEASRDRIPFTWKNCLQEWPILLHFSLPATMAGMMVTPITWLCNAILVNQTGGFSEMGIFDAANQWLLAILFVPNMISRIVLPMLSNLNHADNLTNYRKVLKYNIILNGGSALVFALPVSIFANFIMKTYGNGFEQGRWVLVYLTLTSVIIAINGVVGQVIASKGQMWIGLLFNGLWAACLIILTYTLTQNGYGSMGLALANLIAYSLHTSWQYIYVAKIITHC